MLAFLEQGGMIITKEVRAAAGGLPALREGGAEEQEEGDGEGEAVPRRYVKLSAFAMASGAAPARTDGQAGQPERRKEVGKGKQPEKPSSAKKLQQGDATNWINKAMTRWHKKVKGRKPALSHAGTGRGHAVILPLEDFLDLYTHA